MSDQGDAGQWRPASHTDPYSEPDDATGPLPSVGRGAAAQSAFPPVSAPLGDDTDDTPTGGFPSVSATRDPAPPGPRERSPFEPADTGAPAPARPAGTEPGASPSGRTPGFSFPSPDADDEAGAGSTPSYGASSSFPPATGPGSADDAAPAPDTSAGAEEHYGFGTSPAAGSPTGTGSGAEGPAAYPPATPGGAPSAEAVGRAHTPAFGSDAWNEPPASGPDTWASPSPSGSHGREETDTWSAGSDDRAGGPAFGSGAWGEPSPGSDGRDEGFPAATGAGSDTPAFGTGAWGDAPASGSDAPAEGSSGPGAGSDTPAFGTSAWSRTSPSGSDGPGEGSASAGDGWNDTSAFGTGGWGDPSPSEGEAWDGTPASAPGASGEPAPFASSTPDTWTDTPLSSGRHRAGPPDAASAFEADIPPVDPYDARDSKHGYEVSEPSFGLGTPPSGPSGRRAVSDDGAASGHDTPDVSSAWETSAFDGMPDTRGRAAAAGDAPGTSLDDPAPPGPFGAPGEPFADRSAGGGFAGSSAGSPSSGGDRPASADHDADHEFFGPTDDPATWGSVGAPSGPPPQPGKPSSGNLRLPDWMREESGGAAAGPTGPGGPGGDTAGAAGSPAYDYRYEDEEGRSRLPLIAGLGVLVAGLVVAAGVYLLKGGGGDRPSPAAHVTSAPNRPDGAGAPGSAGGSAQQPQKALPMFPGRHTTAVGRIADQRAALSYPKLGRPWQMEPKGQMAELGFTAGQYAVTEKAGGAPKLWARLMSGPLHGADNGAYQGPETVQAATAQVAATYEAKLYGFKHHKKLLASEPLQVDGHAGWLVGYHLTYHRAATRATGELFTVAVIDTGKQAPAVLLMSVPDSDRALYPDVDYVVHALKAH